MTEHLADKLAVTELLYGYAELIDAGDFDGVGVLLGRGNFMGVAGPAAIAGLFAATEGAEIRNLSLTGLRITAGSMAGGPLFLSEPGTARLSFRQIGRFPFGRAGKFSYLCRTKRCKI